MNGDNALIKDCKIEENPIIGILIQGVENCSVTDSIIRYQEDQYALGIKVMDSTNTSIINSFISGNGERYGDGIFIVDSFNTRISNNSITVQDDGISLERSDHTVIRDNIIQNTEQAVSSSSCSDIRLLWNEFGYSVQGGNFQQSNQIFIDAITIYHNEYGFIFEECDRIMITGTEAAVTESAIELLSSTNSTIFSNLMGGGGIYIEGLEAEHWSTHTIDPTNTFQGKPILYIRNATSGTISDTFGQVILYNCTNNSLRDMSFADACVAIQMGFCSSIDVWNITIEDSEAGIILFSSDTITIRNSHFENCMSGIVGILLEQIVVRNVSTDYCPRPLEMSGSSGVSVQHSVFHGSDVDLSDCTFISISDNLFLINSFETRDCTDIAIRQNNMTSSRILLRSSDEISIRDNLFSEGYIFLIGASFVLIENNTITDVDSDGIRIEDGVSLNISSNYIGQVDEFGIVIQKSTDVSIFHNIVIDSKRGGISLHANGTVVVQNNFCSANNYFAISIKSYFDTVEKPSFFIVESNSIFNNTGTGISMTVYQQSLLVRDNTCNMNSGGMAIQDSHGNVILTGNQCNENSYDGILVRDSGNVTIINTSANGNEKYGLNIRDSNYISIHRLNVNNSRQASINIRSSGEIYITNSSLTISDYGLFVHENTGFISIMNSTIMDDRRFGIFIERRTGRSLNAIMNYWGHDSGPYHESTNPDGIGSSVTDLVIYSPWLKMSNVEEPERRSVDRDREDDGLDDLDDDPLILVILTAILVFLSSLLVVISLSVHQRPIPKRSLDRVHFPQYRFKGPPGS